MLGCEIKTVDDLIGSLQDIDFEKEKCWVKVNGDVKEYNLDEIRRIL